MYAHYTAINIYLLIFNAVLHNNAVCVLHITFPESIRSRIQCKSLNSDTWGPWKLVLIERNLIFSYPDSRAFL